MHTEKTRLQHQIWPQKRGQFLDLQFAPFPIEGWFWGPLVGPRNGPRNSAFFLLLLPYHLGPNIWPAWPQLQRFSACQTGFTTEGSTCSKCPCTIIIIFDLLLLFWCPGALLFFLKHAYHCISRNGNKYQIIACHFISLLLGGNGNKNKNLALASDCFFMPGSTSCQTRNTNCSR